MKIRRKKTQRESAGDFLYFCLYSLSQVFNDINDNYNFNSLCTLSLYAHKVQKYDCLY